MIVTLTRLDRHNPFYFFCRRAQGWKFSALTWQGQSFLTLIIKHY